MSISTNAVLELDLERGVIYVHSQVTGLTMLRICGLPKITRQDVIGFIDITIRKDQPAVTQIISKPLELPE